VDTNIKHMSEVLKRAAEHKGVAFVEVYQNCVVFNDGAFDYATSKETKADSLVELEHGKPLIFGKNKDKGVRLNMGTMIPEVVTLGNGISPDDLIFHDEKAPQPTLAYMLSRMHHPELPEPIGVFRAVEKPTFDAALNDQVQALRDKKGEGDISALINGGETWTIA
jgi:2-oxoglutarate ferredoxin oxidoreductase subunit beta